MVTVRGNALTLCGWHSNEAGHAVTRSERLRIEDNLIRDSKSAGILLVNVHGALVRRNTFESVTSYFAPAQKYLSLRGQARTDMRISDRPRGAWTDRG